MRIINAMPISSITLAIVAFFIKKGCGEAPAASGSGILRPEHDRHLKEDPAVDSSLSMIDSNEQLIGVSLGQSLGYFEYVEVEVDTKETDSKSSKKETDSKSSKKETDSKSSKTETPSEQPSDQPSDCTGWCRRRLEEGELPVQEDVPLEERLSIIKSMEHLGAKRDATFSFEYDLISKTSCDSLIQHMDTSIKHDVESQVNPPTGKASDNNGYPDNESWFSFEGGFENQYNKKLYADELVAMIGKEESMKIIDFFEKSLNGLTIDCMYLARHGDPGPGRYTTPWHKDDYATMEITLNDNYDGGHVLHLNESGVHKTDARPGSATAHLDDIAHGITPNSNGAKYMLILKHHFHRPDKVGVVRLSKQMVSALVEGE